MKIAKKVDFEHKKSPGGVSEGVSRRNGFDLLLKQCISGKLGVFEKMGGGMVIFRDNGVATGTL